MDRTDASTLSFVNVAKLKIRNPFTRSRMRATPRTDSESDTSVPSAVQLDAKRSNSNSSCCTPVQHLPTEIVLDVLEHLVPSVYERAVRFRTGPRALYKELKVESLEVLKETQRTLGRAALVCKAWYPAFNQLLYAHPFLVSSKSVDLFSRTLRSSPDLRAFTKDVWVFSDEGITRPGLPVVRRRKNQGREQEEFMNTLRTLTSIESVIVCNHGLTIKDHPFPVDNILIYSLPPASKSAIPQATLHGPGVFNIPWTRHAKPNNFVPAELESLCLRDIESSPAQVKCAPYLPTLPRLHTLKIAMFNHNETPFVSSGTLPALRSLELYRDVFDETQRDLMRVVAVDEACLRKLERLVVVGRAAESMLFRKWAQDSELFEEVRHLAVGLLHPDEHSFVAEWHLPRHLETLEVVVWYRPKAASGAQDGEETDLDKMGDAEGVLKALGSCLRRNRQSRSFKMLVVRATDVLPRKVFSSLLDELQELCNEHNFEFQLHETDIQHWIETRLAGTTSS